jgi:hypothetical protein
MPESTDTITKEKFMEYLRKRTELESNRKQLDIDYGSTYIEKYEEKKQKYSLQKEKQNERHRRLMAEESEEGEEYRTRMREKGKKSWARRKAEAEKELPAQEELPPAQEEFISRPAPSAREISMQRSGRVPVRKNRFVDTPVEESIPEEPPVPAKRGYEKIRNLF